MAAFSIPEFLVFSLKWWAFVLFSFHIFDFGLLLVFFVFEGFRAP